MLVNTCALVLVETVLHRQVQGRGTVAGEKRGCQQQAVLTEFTCCI